MSKSRPIIACLSSSGVSMGAVAFEVALAAAGDGEAVLPEWIQLTPRGRVNTRDGRAFAFDPERLVNAWQGDVVKRLSIDFEHEGEYVQTLGSRPARAWIIELAARPEGLFGKIEWGDDGASALRARHYRYISPTIWLDPDGVGARQIKGASLVKSPALGMPALASTQPPEQTMNALALLAALGLAPTATEAEALAAISAQRVDLTQYVPKAQHDQTVAALGAAQADIAQRDADALTARCTALVDGAIKDGRLVPAAREQYLALASASYDATKAAIEAMPVIAPKTSGEGQAGDPDPAQLGGQLTDAERAVARNMGLSVEAYLAARGASAA
ncbi:phage protease [Camelimonas lactis]|uniref:Phage I-like protein n=1 Tax=Camelimonas lactis TaxID=659006 RepID=A0A4R2GR08_9HYPH|nr:phage protease [Camelimonas lactis]TCO12433.1 phage I-like protein [Camelimonas lactis]